MITTIKFMQKHVYARLLENIYDSGELRTRKKIIPTNLYIRTKTD